MPTNINLKSLIDKSLEGSFGYVYSALQAFCTALDGHSYVKIMVACCNNCHKNFSTPDKVIEDELVKLVRYVVDCMKTVSNQDFETFLQSIFYILKLLLEKNAFDKVVSLKEAIIPKFQPSRLNETAKNTYSSITKCLYNSVVKVTRLKDIQYSNSVVKMSRMLVFVCGKTCAQSSFLELTHNCAIGLTALRVPPTELVDFFSDIIEHLDLNDDYSEVYHSMVGIFETIYTHLITVEEQWLASYCYKIMREKLESFQIDDLTSLNDVLGVIEWISGSSEDSESLQLSYKKLKSYYDTYQVTQNLQTISSCISCVAVTALQLNKKNSRWLGVSEDNQKQYYKLLIVFASVHVKTPKQCECRSCKVQTNVKAALSFYGIIIGLCRLHITSKGDASRAYKLDAFKYVEKYIEYTIYLKGKKCCSWSKFWYDCGAFLYNVGVYLMTNKDADLALLYLNKLIQCWFRVEYLQSEIFDKCYLSTAMEMVSENYFENGDYKSCLFTIALNMAVCGTCKSKMIKWIQAKAACKNDVDADDIQKLTVVSIFKVLKDKLVVSFPYNNFSLTEDERFQLLAYELRGYKAKWKSKIPMAAAYKDILKIAEIEAASNFFIEIWGSTDLAVSSDILSLLNETINRLEASTVSHKDEYLAHLYFLKHWYKCKDVGLKRCKEIEKNESAPKEGENEGSDEDYTFEFFNSLKLSEKVKVMKNLDKSINMAQSCALDGLSVKDRFFKLLINLGHEYMLYYHVIKALQAWDLALKMAQTDENKLNKLEIISCIIQVSDLHTPLIEKLVIEGDLIAESLEIQTLFEQVAVYLLCKAAAFIYVNFPVAYAALKQVYTLKNTYVLSPMIEAKLLLIQHKFNFLPCEFEVDGHKTLVKIHEALKIAVDYYNHNFNSSSSDMRLFLDINEAMVKMYHDLRLPREVHCYGRTVYILSQNLRIPLRHACYLFYVSYADIRRSRFDHCAWKVKGLSDILCLSDFKSSVKSPKTSPNKVIEDLDGRLREMRLEPLSSELVKYTLLGSPVFSAETFKMPTFLEHHNACECFFCTSLEYHEFVLKKTCLHAVLHEHHRNFGVSKQFFMGGLKMFERLNKKQEVLTKCLRKILYPGLLPAPSKRYIETYCLSLLEYAYYCCRRKQLNDAKKINSRALDLLDSFHLDLASVYLYNEVNFQRINILLKENELTTINDDLNTAMMGSCSDTDLDEAVTETTPEQKSKPDVIFSILKHHPVEPGDIAKIKPKSLKFDFSDEEDDSKPTQVKTKSNVKSTKRKKVASNGGHGTDSSNTMSKLELKKETAEQNKKNFDEIPLGKAKGGHGIAEDKKKEHVASRKSARNRRM